MTTAHPSSSNQSSSNIEKRLHELGLSLPQASKPAANYAPFIIHDSLLYISGQLPFEGTNLSCTGQVGVECSVEDATKAAQLSGLHILAQAKEALGSLDRIEQIIKLVGFVNSPANFTAQPTIINGASDLMVAVFGDKGRHSRSAVSAAALPLNASVEIEAIIALK